MKTTESNTAVAEMPRKTASKTSKAPQFKNEADVLKKLHLASKETLTKTDHQNIAAAARAASKPLRKTNPQLAAALYYVHYKHSKLLSKKARN